MNGYICIYKGVQLKLRTDTAARAQAYAAEAFKAKLADVSVFDFTEAVKLLTDLRNYEVSARLTINRLKPSFSVYGPEVLTDRVWFTDGKRIGCAQFDGQYWTVHKPCKYNGEGFPASTAQDALAGASCAYFKKVVPKLYADFSEFNRTHNFVQY